MNPNNESKKGLLPSATSKKQRIVIFGGGLVLLLLILTVAFSVLFGGGGNGPLTLSMAQQHTELIRITEIGEEKARGQAAKNLATTTRLTLQSSEEEILAIANSVQKVDKKLLVLGQSAETDKTLTEAEQRSRFDEIFTVVMSEQLEVYRKDLQTAFDTSGSSKNKQFYATLYDQLGDIIDTASGAQN